MVILHVANIKTESLTGVAIAVPQHVKAQSKMEQVAFLNISNFNIDGIENQFTYEKNFKLEKLPEPFSKPDLVVFHNLYHKEFLKIAGRINKKKIPYIIVPHGALSSLAQQKKVLKKKVANFIFFNSFLKGASAIQFLSQQEMLSSKCNFKGFIGSNGVDIPEMKSFLKQRDGIKFVYIGRTEVYIKGLDMMIESVQKNKQLFADKNISLDLYGPDYMGRHAQVLALISKYGVEDYVFLHDAVVGKEKGKILLDADLFIQTSRSEGMPLGLLEALGYGIPCLVTEGTSLGSVIEGNDAGWVAKTNKESIAETIEKAVLEKDLWSKKSQNAIRLIKENYTWEKVVKDTITKYKELI